MIEVLVAVWVTLLGVVVLVAVSGSMSAWGLALVAPLVGTAGYVLAGLVLVSVNLFSTVGALSLATVGAGAGALAWFLIRREAPPGRTVLLAALFGTALAIGVAAAGQAFGFARLTTDSFEYLMSAEVLERNASLSGIRPIDLLKRQLAAPMLHTVGTLTGRGYVAFWTPLLSVSAVGTMMWLGFRSFGFLKTPWRWGAAIGVAALALVLTTNRVLFHVFYVNGHMLFAGLLLVGVGFVWLGAVTDRWGLVVPAAVGFAAMVPLRAESLIVVAIFLVPILSAVATPLWAGWVLVVPVAAATVVWDVVALPPHLPDAELTLTGSVYGNVWVAAGLVVLVALRHFAVLQPAVRFAPWVMFGVVVAFVVVRAWRDFPLLWDSLTATASNLATTGRWSAFWWVVPLLFFAALLAAVVPLERFFTFGVATFVVALFAFAYLRGSAYRASPDDSANRMVMHIVFVVVLYIMVAAAAATRRAFPTQEPTAARR